MDLLPLGWAGKASLPTFWKDEKAQARQARGESTISAETKGDGGVEKGGERRKEGPRNINFQKRIAMVSVGGEVRESEESGRIC